MHDVSVQRFDSHLFDNTVINLLRIVDLMHSKICSPVADSIHPNALLRTKFGKKMLRALITQICNYKLYYK